MKPLFFVLTLLAPLVALNVSAAEVVSGFIFVMPDKISEEKRAALRAFGSKVVITPTAVEPTDPRSYLSVAKKLGEITH